MRRASNREDRRRTFQWKLGMTDMSETGRTDPRRATRYRRYLKSELHAAALYSALARIEDDAERSRVFRDLYDSEIEHARVWAAKLGNRIHSSTQTWCQSACSASDWRRHSGRRSSSRSCSGKRPERSASTTPSPRPRTSQRTNATMSASSRAWSRGQTEPAPLWEESPLRDPARAGTFAPPCSE